MHGSIDVLPRPAMDWQIEELDLLLWLNALTKCQPYQPAKNQKDFKLTTQDVQGDLGLTTQGIQSEQRKMYRLPRSSWSSTAA